MTITLSCRYSRQCQAISDASLIWLSYSFTKLCPTFLTFSPISVLGEIHLQWRPRYSFSSSVGLKPQEAWTAAAKFLKRTRPMYPAPASGLLHASSAIFIGILFAIFLIALSPFPNRLLSPLNFAPAAFCSFASDAPRFYMCVRMWPMPHSLSILHSSNFSVIVVMYIVHTHIPLCFHLHFD